MAAGLVVDLATLQPVEVVLISQESTPKDVKLFGSFALLIWLTFTGYHKDLSTGIKAKSTDQIIKKLYIAEDKHWLSKQSCQLNTYNHPKKSKDKKAFITEHFSKKKKKLRKEKITCFL